VRYRAPAVRPIGLLIAVCAANEIRRKVSAYFA